MANENHPAHDLRLDQETVDFMTRAQSDHETWIVCYVSKRDSCGRGSGCAWVVGGGGGWLLLRVPF